MMLGLGVYLPFYMSLTTAVGALIRVVFDRVVAARGIEKGAAEETGAWWLRVCLVASPSWA